MPTITALKDWLDGMGWLANAFALIAPISAAYALRGRIKDALGFRSFSALTSALLGAHWSTDRVKAIAKVAIVDDNLSDFPIADLRHSGFQIKSYRKVRLSDVETLAAFDIVFLDMHGIVADDVEAGGLKLIARLRDANPSQKICAVSSKTFDPTATNFFRQADEVQKKPITAQKCSDVIIDLAKDKLDPLKLAAYLDYETEYMGGWKRRRLISRLKSLVESERSVESLDSAPELSELGSVVAAQLLLDLLRVLRNARS